HYSIPPGHPGELVHVSHRLGTSTLDVISGREVHLAHHIRQPDGAGAVCRLDEHVSAMSRVVLANFSAKEPCRSKTRRPPEPEALSEAERIRRARVGLDDDRDVVVDFARYADDTRLLQPDQHNQESQR
ncbi:MAG: hypothetical protein ACRDUV_26090, partial [Pseudonocardiaceae bacterium]